MTLLRHIQIFTAHALVPLGLAVLSPFTLWAQSAGNAGVLVNHLRTEIKSADSSPTNAGRVGDLWRQLGTTYQMQYNFNAAEDAYSRALPLLQAAGEDSEYADALHGLGSIYLSTQRRAEARKCFAASLAIYEKLHDATSAANVHQASGIDLLFSGKYKEAAAEFSASLDDLKGGPIREPEPLISSYVLRGGAEYRSGDAAQALADSASAQAAAIQFHLPANSIERIGAALVQGAALTRLGRFKEADAAIQEAMEQAASRTELPQMISMRMQVGILREYSVALKAAHRKQEAKRTEAQAAKLQSTLPRTCAECTVSIAALRGPH